MKYELKAWPDTGNVDLKFTPETQSDQIILQLLRGRVPRWNEGTAIELIFDASKKPS